MPAKQHAWIAKNGRLEIYEGCNGYYVRDSVTDDTYGIGDGVGMYSDKDGNGILPGTKSWYAELRRDIRENGAEWKIAYFSE